MSGDRDALSLSVIMPALNEEDNVLSAIERTLSAFDHLGIHGEIIVVNDGSTDNTGVLVEDRAAREEAVRMIVHEKPEGIGASFWDGVKAAHGEVVTMFPGDDENEPLEALRYLHLFENVDIVVPFICNKGMRSKRREQLSIKTIKRGYLFAEVPNLLRARESGSSKALTFKSFLDVAQGFTQLGKDMYFSKSNTFNTRDIVRESATFKRLSWLHRHNKDMSRFIDRGHSQK
jgi:glycosyltransferase involved in cell wall biosynthesis